MNLSDVKLVDSEFAFVCTEWVHSCKLFCTLYVPTLPEIPFSYSQGKPLCTVH